MGEEEGWGRAAVVGEKHVTQHMFFTVTSSTCSLPARKLLVNVNKEEMKQITLLSLLLKMKLCKYL